MHTVDVNYIYEILEDVKDPEVPVLSVIDLGIVRDVKIISKDKIKVLITPTYSGCPAMGTIAIDIRTALWSKGFQDVIIEETLDPAWTTDWMSEEGKRKLEEYGIAPPRLSSQKEAIRCPQCQSNHVKKISEFGSTSCKSLYRCEDCLEPFDYFKCI